MTNNQFSNHSFQRASIAVMRIVFIILAVLVFLNYELVPLKPPPNEIEELCIYNEAITIEHDEFYYNQLTDLEKEIYKVLVNSEEFFIKNESFLCISGPIYEAKDYFAHIKRAVYAYRYDNPISSLYLLRYEIHAVKSIVYKNGYYDYYIYPHHEIGKYADLSTEDIGKKLVELENITRDFVSKLSGTEVQKLTQIHDWLIKEAVYDSSLSLLNNYNLYGAIIEKNCGCAGYAYAFKYIADMAGLDVIYVTGMAYNGNDTAYHAWNLACINEKWYLIDVTWDVCLKKNTCFLLPIGSQEKNNTKHTFEEEKFSYP